MFDRSANPGAGRRHLVFTVLGLIMGGCAAAPPCTPAAPATATARTRESADGVCLAAYAWAPKAPRRGVVVIVHGIRDHAERYDELAKVLADDGFEVRAQDLRGHGHSGGARQRFDSIDLLVADLDGQIEEIARELPGVPVFLYGHSLGGLIATEYGLAYPRKIHGVVLSGAALRLMPDVTGGQKAAAKFFGTVFPGLAAQKVDDAAFVRTEGAKQGLASDKLITHDDLPAASARAAIIAIENLTEAQLAKWSIPILIMHGTADVTTNVEGSKLLAAKAAVADKTLKLWPGTAHDLLHEPESAAVIETTRGWLDAHARAPTAVEGAASAPAPEAEPLPKHEP